MKPHKILNRLIKERRSRYPSEYLQGEPIDERIIKKIVRSATYAPNHRKTKPWRLKIFRESEKNKLAEQMALIYKENTPKENFSKGRYEKIIKKIKKADTIVSIGIHFSGKVDKWEEIAAVAMAVQNMYLTCTAYQLGCYWSTPKFANKLKKFLELNKNEECYGIFFIGKL